MDYRVWWRMILVVAVVTAGWAGPIVSAQEEMEPEPLRLSMEFKDANLKDVLKVFSQQTGINVIANEDISEQEITLYLDDVAAMDALDQILAAGGLVYERPAGSEIYIVKRRPASATAGVSIETRIYRLKYARVSTGRLATAVESLVSQTPFEGQTISIGGIAGEGGGESSQAGGDAAGGSGGGTEVGIDKIVERLLSAQGSVAVDERTNSLIVSEVPSNFPRIEAVLNALDIRTAQLMIEAEVLETSLGKIEDIGVEWSTASEGDLAILTPGSRSTRFPFSWLGHGDAPSTSSAFTSSTLSAASARATLQLLERDTSTKILARPKVLTLDNEAAVIKLVTDQVVAFTRSESAEGGTSSVEPQRKTTGVILVVTAQTSGDGYITMLVEPAVTRTVAAEVDPPEDLGTVVDTRTRTARSLVRIRNGDSLVLGGLLDRSDNLTDSKVPFFGDVPVLGQAFKNKEINNSVRELLVFVTPQIMPDEPAGNQVASAAWATGLRDQDATEPRRLMMDDVMLQLEGSGF